MKTPRQRYIVVTENKRILWDPETPLRLPLPLKTELVCESGQGYLQDRATKEVVAEFNLADAQKGGAFVVPGTRIQLFRARALPSAAEDLNHTQSSIRRSTSSDFYVYEGSGKQLQRFEKVKKRWKDDDIQVEVKNAGLEILVRETPILVRTQMGPGQSPTERRVLAHQSYNIELADLPRVELIQGDRWWKFSSFQAPLLMDESEYEWVDAQDVRQNRVFQFTFFVGALLSIYTLMTHPMGRAPAAVDSAVALAGSEVKIDRSLIEQAKPLLVEPPKVEPTPVVVQTPVAVATPVPTPAVVTSVAKVVQKQKTAEGPPKQANYNGKLPTAKVPARSTGGGGGGGGAGNSEQILSQHSKLLQDAFGGVLAAGKVQADGKALATSPHPSAVGSGFFTNGTGRGANPSAGAVGGLLAQSGSPDHFVKAGQVSFGSDPQGKGYGKVDGKLNIAGQGSGVALPGAAADSGAGMNQAAIASVFREHAAEIRSCYEMALVSRPDIHGGITLAFGIQPDGRVSSATLKMNQLKDKNDRSPASADLVDCILNRVRSWKFPKPSDGNPVQVTAYPLELKNVGGP